jgi:hypothetical protein
MEQIEVLIHLTYEVNSFVEWVEFVMVENYEMQED